MRHESSRALRSHRTQTSGSCVSAPQGRFGPKCPAADPCLCRRYVDYEDVADALFLSEVRGCLVRGGLDHDVHLLWSPVYLTVLMVDAAVAWKAEIFAYVAIDLWPSR